MTDAKFQPGRRVYNRDMKGPIRPELNRIAAGWQSAPAWVTVDSLTTYGAAPSKHTGPV